MVQKELTRDVPFPSLSKRFEKNRPEILSGVFEGRTIGTPISILIPNTDARSSPYRPSRSIPRPGHADLTYLRKYGHVDWRGGSRASGRNWISVVAAGAVAKRLCDGIDIGSSIIDLGGIEVRDNVEEVVERIVESNRKDGDSTGGTIEVIITGLPQGLGAPMFDRFHADIGHAVLSIPGVRSFRLGREDMAFMKGSHANDEYIISEGRIEQVTNNSSGVLGGITTGEEFIFRLSVKPTPSIPIPQRSVDMEKMEETDLRMEGRFDINFSPRVQVIAEAVSAVITVDHLMLSGRLSHDSLLKGDDIP